MMTSIYCDPKIIKLIQDSFTDADLSMMQVHYSYKNTYFTGMVCIGDIPFFLDVEIRDINKKEDMYKDSVIKQIVNEIENKYKQVKGKIAKKKAKELAKTNGIYFAR